MTQTPAFDNYVGGAWVGSEDRTENVNPSDLSDVIGRYAQADADTVAEAVQAARHAWPEWAEAGPLARSQVLSRASGQLAARSAELGDLLARELGKPIAEAVAEVNRAAQIFDFFAGEALRNAGTVIDSVRPGLIAEMHHDPMGVVGVITPWNFPIAIPAWKIAPALAFGNAVVFKPAGITPGCAWELTRILADAGLPDGVLNLVMGSGAVTGAAMTGSSAVDALSFTGSQAVGRGLAAACVAQGIKVQCEMGGKNPLVVLGDADLDHAVECALNGAFFSNGQRCTASSRLIVTADVHDEFVDRLLARVGAMTVGDARDPGSAVGPISSRGQLEGNLAYVRTAREEGGEVHGGERLRLATDGHYMSPALVTGTTNAMTINREEVFGPVAAVIRVADYDEALATANDTEFGLSSGICTGSLAHAADFKRRSQAGMVMVNAPTAGVDPHVSFGGRKGSSYGAREQGSAAREFYTQHKTTYTDPR
ncbi:aldehyde dehydrogenase family protein [Micrococcus sp. TA1]|uniref:aldehyde dehydrogenase family protein n=1 Tax=Micrococcus sp. TA1 TaxID=681627 RepID=UPI001610EB89|nr:aldehyde dehydrogenase family protein [Micrococcus sp. TA1]MBB5750161.1 aldehyde dehydrogenase (NAD+) [Micrococcus sp. TA1]